MKTTRMLSMLIAVLLASALTVACQPSDTGTVRVGITSSVNSSASADLVDAESLWVTISSVQVHIAGTTESAPAGAPDENVDRTGDERRDGWTTVYRGAEKLDLLDPLLTNDFLAQREVPAGRVTQVRLVLGDSATLVDGEGARTVTCPSCTQTGIKIVPQGRLVVPEGGVLDLELDFRSESLIRTQGGLILSPVIRVTGEVAR